MTSKPCSYYSVPMLSLPKSSLSSQRHRSVHGNHPNGYVHLRINDDDDEEKQKKQQQKQPYGESRRRWTPSRDDQAQNTTRRKTS
mmetsp:Transcript_7299/g.14203  ORF Transcript_7299/g.14203 Transcript_7299/m.14203 type:complete len:85 (-) Transcript_7299:6-260(-)